MNPDQHIVRDILVSKLSHFEAKIAKINDKLRAGGLPPIEVTNHGTSYRMIDLNGRGMMQLPMATVSISRQAPSPTAGQVQVLAKTSLDLSLESKAMLHKTYGTLNKDERSLVENPPNPKGCDHCSSNRNRAYIYTLKTPGGLMRVGGGCLKEFVGFDMSKWTTHLNDAIEEADKYSTVTFREQDENQVIPLRVFLAIANNLIEQDGYRNRDMGFSTGAEAFGKAQADVAGGAQRENAMDTEAVDNIVTFIKTSIHRPEDAQKDYFVNLRTMVDVGFLTIKQSNLLASAPQAFRRHAQELARKEEEKRRQQGTEHVGRHFVGQLKERLLLEDLTVDYVFAGFDELYGSYTKISFVDPKGNYFSWKASGVVEGVEKGQVLQVLGTITKHETYHSKTFGRDLNDNKISRCSFLTPEEVLETRKKLEKAAAKARKKLDQDSPSP